jgi:lipopolysaccharide export system permease protein
MAERGGGLRALVGNLGEGLVGLADDTLSLAKRLRSGEAKLRMPRLRDFRVLLLDRYIFREFAISFLAVLAFCTLLLLVASIFERLDSILKNETPLGKAAQYFMCSLPFRVMQAVPIAATLAVLFSIGSLARTNEILAMLTSGVHALRLAAPVLFGGLLIFVGSVVMNEYVVPPLQHRANYLELRYIEGKEESKITAQKNVFRRGRDNRFYLLRRYYVPETRMDKPLIVDLTPDYRSVRGRMEADSAVMLSNDPENRRSSWEFTNLRRWTFTPEGKLIAYEEKPGGQLVTLEEDLPTILSQKKEPEEMNYAELAQHVRILADRRQPVHGFRTDLALKVAFPLGILVIMVIAFSYAARTRAGTVMKAFGYGTLWAIVYYAVTAMMRALGHSGTVSPFVASYFTLAVFAVIAAYYLRKSYRWYS